MIKKKKKKEKIDFLLQNKHYQRLHLILYLLSLLFIVSFYFLLVLVFSSYSPSYFLTGFVSVSIGIYLVFKREKLVRFISDFLEEKKRKKLKQEKKEGLKTTLKEITPKNKKLKLNIKSRVPLKEKVKSLKHKLKKKDKNKPDYLEIE